MKTKGKQNLVIQFTPQITPFLLVSFPHAVERESTPLSCNGFPITALGNDPIEKLLS